MEKELSEFLGAKKCLLVNSGSSANLVAISTLTSHKLKEKKISQGDEVITAANTFVATVGAINELGVKIVFVDCDDTFCMNVEQIEDKINEKTKLFSFLQTTINIFDQSCTAILKNASEKKINIIAKEVFSNGRLTNANKKFHQNELI